MLHHLFDKGTTKRRMAYLVFIHVFFGLLIVATVALAFGYIVMLLWNAIVVDLLSVRPLTYWQSVGLLVLVRILIGGLGHGPLRHRRGRHGRLRRDYDEWWKEVGEKSFQGYADHDEPKK